MMLPPTATSVPKASAFPFGAFAEGTAKSLDHSESTGLLGPCVALALLTGSVLKMRISGRALWIGPTDALLRKHRRWLSTDAAKQWYARRKVLSEPTFGILKEQLASRRFLLRGLVNVRAEFALLATAFNLWTLWRVWRTRWRSPVTQGLQHLNRPVTISS